MKRTLNIQRHHHIAFIQSKTEHAHLTKTISIVVIKVKKDCNLTLTALGVTIAVNIKTVRKWFLEMVLQRSCFVAFIDLQNVSKKASCFTLQGIFGANDHRYQTIIIKLSGIQNNRREV